MWKYVSPIVLAMIHEGMYLPLHVSNVLLAVLLMNLEFARQEEKSNAIRSVSPLGIVFI